MNYIAEKRNSTFVAVKDTRATLLIKTLDLLCWYRNSTYVAVKDIRPTLLLKKLDLLCC